MEYPGSDVERYLLVGKRGKDALYNEARVWRIAPPTEGTVELAARTSKTEISAFYARIAFLILQQANILAVSTCSLQVTRYLPLGERVLGSVLVAYLVC